MLRAKTDHLGLLPPLAETGFKIPTLQEEGAEVDSLSPVVQLIVWTLDKLSFLKTFAFFFFFYIYIFPLLFSFSTCNRRAKQKRLLKTFLACFFSRDSSSWKKKLGFLTGKNHELETLYHNEAIFLFEANGLLAQAGKSQRWKKKRDRETFRLH